MDSDLIFMFVCIGINLFCFFTYARAMSFSYKKGNAAGTIEGYAKCIKMLEGQTINGGKFNISSIYNPDKKNTHTGRFLIAMHDKDESRGMIFDYLSMCEIQAVFTEKMKEYEDENKDSLKGLEKWTGK